jgi:pilus assembly protein CpaB
MTKRSNLILFVIAMLLALFTTLVVMNQLTQLRTKKTSEQAISVVVVDKPIAAHQVVSASDVSLQTVAKSAVQSGVMTSLSEVVGRYTGSQWFAGQQVLSSMVLDRNTAAAFPVSIPNGERAFTIANDPVTGVDHLISNGDHVDILVSYNSPKPTATTLLQNIQVLHVDSAPPSQPSQATVNGTSSSGNGDPKQLVDTLTVAVNPQQAAALDYAMSFGKIHVVLRNPSDTNVTANYTSSTVQ